MTSPESRSGTSDRNVLFQSMARSSGQLLVLLLLSSSLFALFEYRGAAKTFDRLKGHLDTLDRASNDLESIRISFLRREALGSGTRQAFSASRFAVIRGLRMQSLADLEDLEHLPLAGPEHAVLESLAAILKTKVGVPGPFPIAPDALALELRDVRAVLALTATIHETLARETARDRIGLHDTLHRRERLLTLSIVSLALGTVFALSLLLMSLVLRREKKEIGRRDDLLQGILSSTTNGVVLKDLEGRWIGLSPRIRSLLNLTFPADRFPGKTDAEILALCPTAGPVLCPDPGRSPAGGPEQWTASLDGPDSRPVHLLIDRSPLCSEDGAVMGTILSVIEITDRIVLENLEKAANRIASLGLVAKDPESFLSRCSEILMEHCDCLLVWTTRVRSGPDGALPDNPDAGALIPGRILSRSSRFHRPPDRSPEFPFFPVLENGMPIDLLAVLHRAPRLTTFSSRSNALDIPAFPESGTDIFPGPAQLTAACYPISQSGRPAGTLGVLSRISETLAPRFNESLLRISGTLSLVLESLDSDFRRQAAEKRSLLLRNFYEALSKVEALLLSLPTRERLLDSVCRILDETDNANSCWVRMEDPVSREITIPYFSGRFGPGEIDILTRLANDPDVRSSPGFSRPSLRSGTPNVSNNLEQLADSWKPARFLIELGVSSLCSLPIMEEGVMIHSLVVAGDQRDYFTPELISLLSQLTDSLSFGLGNIGRESQRRQNAIRTERLKNMYQALSDSNEILISRPGLESIFQNLCMSIVSHGHAHSAIVYALDKSSGKGELSVWEGPLPSDLSALIPSSDTHLPEGQGIFGQVVRSGESRILNLDSDVAAPTPASRILFGELGIRSIGGFPVRRGGEIERVLLVTSIEPSFFDPELVRLLDRMVLNVSFALDLFDREEVRKEREKAILFQSLHDSLTGLPNRILFLETVDGAIQNRQETGAPFGVGIVDLDNFKEINDRLGHRTGDMLLVEVAKRLQAGLRPNDSLARLGGDEFGILLREIPGDSQELERLLTIIPERLELPLSAGGEMIRGVSLSLGMALFPKQGDSPEVLLKRADLALYESKNRGGGVWTIFSDALETRLERTFMIRTDFDRALDSGETLIHVQPQVSFDTGLPSGAEMLVRWNHPEKGLLLPGSFIQEVEDSPALIRKLGLSMLERSLAHAGSWKDAGLSVPVAINIGARHFLDPNFTEDISRILANHPEIAPDSLQIEITESATLSDFLTVRTILDRLRAMGVEVALDDFGTGHASLSYLQKVPADTIKMDVQFVRNMLVDSKDMAIVAGTLTTARLLKLGTIAEGVESPELGVVLMKLGCRAGQGFGIARPMPADNFPEWLRSFRPDPLWTEWFERPWSRGNILRLAMYMEHRRRSETLFRRLTDPDRQEREPLSLARSPLDLWLDGSGSRIFGHSPRFHEMRALFRESEEIEEQLTRLLPGNQEQTAQTDSMISRHREASAAILSILEGLGPEKLS